MLTRGLVRMAARRIGAGLFALLAALGPASCSGGAAEEASSGGGFELDLPARSPRTLGEVRDFALVDSTGREVGLADLRGAPWIAGFFFTSCPGPCPRLTANMRRAQDLLEGSSVRLVSVSVDPETDTPEVLAAYAQAYGADTSRWSFLTGDEAEIHRWMRASFALAVDKALPGDDAVAGMQITHATRLVVVDPEARVRGYYEGDSNVADEVERAVARARFLEDEEGGSRSPLPLANATLNGTAGLLLIAGLVAIRRGRRALHGGLMRAAFLVSAAFLASYLYYHFVVIPAQGGPVRYGGTGAAKAAYLALLLAHVLGAIVNLPMVLRTLWLAHRRRWEDHRRWARRTYPLWLFVSVSGVLVYLVLYPWNPAWR